LHRTGNPYARRRPRDPELIASELSVVEPRRDNFPNNFVGDLVAAVGGWVVIPPTYCPDGHAYSDPGWSVSSVGVAMSLRLSALRAPAGPALPDP
jgi:hypothetical protein